MTRTSVPARHLALLLAHLAVLGAAGLAAWDARAPEGAAGRAGAGAVGPADEPWSLADAVGVPAEQHGAVGDGHTDDTEALQQGLDALRRGEDLVLAPGRTYRHTGVLRLTRPDTGLTGPGELLAADEERSSLQLQAARTRAHGVVLRITGTTRRWTAREQHRLVLGRHPGIVVSDVQVHGAAGAGVFVEGSSSFVLDDVHVSGTRADGIHMTGGASDGRIRRALVTGTGDDAVAVVSYQTDAVPCRRITVEDVRVFGTVFGRGLSVVGGEDVVYRDVHVERSNAAAVYIATEGAPYFTHSIRRVRVQRAVVVRANTNPQVDHGALLISAAAEGQEVRDVEVSDLEVRDTRPTAARQLGVLAYEPAVAGVRLTGVQVTGGGPLFQSTAADAAVQVTDLSWNGRVVTDPKAATP